MQRKYRLLWLAATALACGKPAAEDAGGPPKPIPVAELARAAERELGALLEILQSEAVTRAAMGAVNSTLVKSGLARGLPNLPAPEDAEACFRTAAASRGLQISSAKSQVPALVTPTQSTLKPGERWQVKREELLGKVTLEIVVNGPLPSVAALVDEVSQCYRIVAVRTAKVAGGSVTLTADAWFERNLATPELDLRWRSLDERLTAAGWKADDPALAKDPAFAQLKSAVDAGREQLPRARALLKTTVELPRWITRTRELVLLKQEVLQIHGAKLLGLSEG